MESSKIQTALDYWRERLTQSYGENHILNITLYGSQNYKIDTEFSDIDVKAIYVPSLRDAVLEPHWVSIEHHNDQNEHCELKDIREMCKMYKKQNINFLETLFTDYRWDNPIYEDIHNRLRENAENIAYMFRKKLGFSNNQPIYNLIDTLENLGIIIIQIPNSEKLFDGFDGLSETINNTPIIIIRDDIVDGARQRFTICHELGHLLLNIKNGIDEEKACNVFASSLLMPKEAIINEFGPIRKNISLYELYQFKREYKVSVAAILYRLKELNVISEYFYKLSNIKLSKNNLKTNEVENITPEQTYQFKKLVHRLCIDELISIDRACELLGVSLDEYNIEDNYYKY